MRWPSAQTWTRWSPVSGRGSLRSELLFNLSFLAAAALLLALWTERLTQIIALDEPRATWLLVALIGLDLIIFVALGGYLVDRLVVRPLAETARVADGIAEGAYQLRAPPAQTAEMARLASALNRLTDQLLQNQQRLAENVRSLDEANRRLVDTQGELVQAEKLASVGRLAAGVAHEIGNPLAAVLGYASLLKRKAVEPELVDGLEREARRIDRIVRTLLDYARPAAAREPVDLNHAVHRVVRLLRQQGRLPHVSVHLELEPDLPPVLSVEHLIDQVFVNLFTNADAAMQGNGRLTVVTRFEVYLPDRPRPPRRADDPPGVDYSHLRRARYGSNRGGRQLEPGDHVVRVIVADSGPGIEPEHIDAIFDPFFTTKRPGEGTGLGLALVASSVAGSGGRVEVSSAPGGGAHFNLWFPIAPEAE